MLEISPDDQENIFRILAAVLWLGNITFSVVDGECHVRVDNDEGEWERLGPLRNYSIKFL